MPEYEVVITSDADADLEELGDYIAFELHDPDTAIRYLRDLRKEIDSLSTRAKHYRVVDDEPWHSRGQRRMNAKNFAVLFILIEDEETVYVQNVIYKRRNIPQILKERYGIQYTRSNNNLENSGF